MQWHEHFARTILQHRPAPSEVALSFNTLCKLRRESPVTAWQLHKLKPDTFCGIPIVCNNDLPENTAMLVCDGKAVRVDVSP